MIAWLKSLLGFKSCGVIDRGDTAKKVPGEYPLFQATPPLYGTVKDLDRPSNVLWYSDDPDPTPEFKSVRGKPKCKTCGGDCGQC